MDYVFATMSRDRASLVKKGKLLLSDALETDKGEGLVTYGSPHVPTNEQDTIVALGFKPQLKINQYVLLIEDAPESFGIPKEILNTAEIEITPTAILYYLAELGLEAYILPSCAKIEDAISATPVEKRDEQWGPYYMKAYGNG